MGPEGRPRLTQEAIAAKALEIIDRDGLVGLSMRRLGRELGVEGMALYRHFPEKKAILDKVVDLVLDDIEYPSGTAAWQENLRLMARSLRDRLLAHPNAMPLFAARWLNTEVEIWHGALSSALQDMRSGGLDPPSAYILVHVVMSFLLGHCWVDVGAFVGDIPETGGLTRLPIPPAKTTADQLGPDPRAAQFEGGLELILRGVKRIT